MDIKGFKSRDGSTHKYDYQALANIPENGAATDEQIAAAVEAYLEENPVQPGATAEQAAQIKANKEAIEKLQQNGGGVDFETDHTLTLKDGILSVNTTDLMEQDNTLPMTSAGVYATVGNIEALLKTI